MSRPLILTWARRRSVPIRCATTRPRIRPVPVLSGRFGPNIGNSPGRAAQLNLLPHLGSGRGSDAEHDKHARPTGGANIGTSRYFGRKQISFGFFRPSDPRPMTLGRTRLSTLDPTTDITAKSGQCRPDRHPEHVDHGVGQRVDESRVRVHRLGARHRADRVSRHTSAASTSRSNRTSMSSQRKPIGRTTAGKCPRARPGGSRRRPARARDLAGARSGSGRRAPSPRPLRGARPTARARARPSLAVNCSCRSYGYRSAIDRPGCCAR